MSSNLRYFRLRGRLGENGPPFLAELTPGVHRLGSIEENDIVVAWHGVSRHHLLLRVDEEITIEDLGSKNGTRVNGRACKRSTVEAGDEIFVGPVRLRLEAIEADDVRLAATADPERQLLDTRDLEVDRRKSEVAELEALDRLMELFSEDYPADTPADQGGQRALEQVAAEIGAGGAAWLLWRERQTCQVTASTGVDFHGLIDLEDLCRRAEAFAGSRRAVVLRTPGPPQLIATVLLARPHPAALLLWDVEIGASAARILARLLDRECALLEVPEMGDEARAPDDVDWVQGPGPASRLVSLEVARLTEYPGPVLITGEAGTGKKHLARWIHAAEGRPGPLVITGCADLTDAALAQGFRIAAEERGTLLLEEISELDASLFEAVLQLLGSSDHHPRLILTSRESDDLGLPPELDRALRRRVIAIEPLRRRREEIPRLLRHFLADLGQANQTPLPALPKIASHQPTPLPISSASLGPNRSSASMPMRGLTVEALRRLMRHGWPGNVEELRATLADLVAHLPVGRAIESSSLPEIFNTKSTPERSSGSQVS